MAQNNSIQYIRSVPPFFDFLATSKDSPEVAQRMAQLGAYRLEVGQAVLYTVGYRPVLGGTVLSGALRRGTSIELGPKQIMQTGDPLIGQCCVIDTESRLKLRPDFFGLLPLYYDDVDVSNRLHLMAEIKRVRGTYRVDEEAIGSTFIAENSFSMQIATFRTPVAGVRLLPAEHWIEIDDAVKLQGQAMAPEVLSTDEYWDLIRKGAEEVTANVAAALHGFDIVEAPITGGRDSRTTMAALVALGRVGDVRFATHERDEDVPIGSGLVKRFGGTYGIERKVHHWNESTLEQRVARRRSFYFGQYHLSRLELFPQLFATHMDRAVQLTGGLGELYRSFYQEKDFAKPYLGEDFSPAVLRDMLAKQQWVEAIPGHLERITPALNETFNALPGKTMDAKLSAHYLNFRSRMHFGLTSLHRQPESLTWNPLASPSLLKAARGLPWSVKNTGRVLFDVTREMCEELAYIPYGKPTPDYSRLPYHRPSRFDGKTVSLTPAAEIVRGAQRFGPRQPKLPKHDVEAMVRRAILDDFAKVPAGPCAFLTGEKVAKRVNWISSKAGIKAADALYSKLDAIVHCLR